MRQINQTNTPKSDRKWRKKVKRLSSKPLFYRTPTLIKQTKISLSSKGFISDLEIATIEENRLEYKLKQQGLSIIELKRYTQLKKDIRLASLLQGNLSM